MHLEKSGANLKNNSEKNRCGGRNIIFLIIFAVGPGCGHSAA